MTKDELATRVSEKMKIEKSLVKNVLKGIVEEVQETMSNGENIYIREFGSFIIKKRKAKLARDINRGTSVPMPARNVPFFKAAPGFKEKVKNSKKIK